MSKADVRATRTTEREGETEAETERQLPELASTINVTSNRVRYHTMRERQKQNE